MKRLIHPVRSNLQAIAAEPLLENEPSDASAHAAPDVPLALPVGGATTSDFVDIRVIYGTEGDDVISWHGGPVLIQGLGGNDTIDGPAGGNVFLSGDAGDDTLHAYGGGNTLWGGDNDDTLIGGDGSDTLDGGAGADLILGGGGNDTIVIHAGDVSFGEVISGEGGFDTLVVSDNDMHPFRGVFTDIEKLLLNSGVQNVFLAPEQLGGFRFIAHQDGSGAAFSITAQFPGTYSLAGATIIGNLTLNGTSGADTLIAGSGNNETLRGGGGGDIVLGGGFNDYLYGGNGSDLLVGGQGGDYLVGGADADVFKYTTVGDSFPIMINGFLQQDQIVDFTQGEDKIDLSAIDANPLLAGDQAFVFIGDPSNHTGDDWTGVVAQMTWAAGDTSIALSTDADADAELIIYMTHPYRFTANDFIL